MCFQIAPENGNHHLRQKRRKVAYKVVVLESNAKLYSIMHRRKTWYPGVHRRSNGQISEHKWWGGIQAKHGIYVFTTLAAAKRDRLAWEVILKVHVSGADLLHVSQYGDMATYNKVEVREKGQPEVEFY